MVSTQSRPAGASAGDRGQRLNPRPWNQEAWVSISALSHTPSGLQPSNQTKGASVSSSVKREQHSPSEVVVRTEGENTCRALHSVSDGKQMHFTLNGNFPFCFYESQTLLKKKKSNKMGLFHRQMWTGIQLCHLALCPWASYPTSLNLTFFFCKVRTMNVSGG